MRRAGWYTFLLNAFQKPNSKRLIVVVLEIKTSWVRFGIRVGRILWLATIIVVDRSLILSYRVLGAHGLWIRDPRRSVIGGHSASAAESLLGFKAHET